MVRSTPVIAVLITGCCATQPIAPEPPIEFVEVERVVEVTREPPRELQRCLRTSLRPVSFIPVEHPEAVAGVTKRGADNLMKNMDQLLTCAEAWVEWLKESQ